MNLSDALAGLGDQSEWKFVKKFIKEQRESCLVDFQDYTHVDNPQKLARLSGEIAGLSRLISCIENEEDDRDSTSKI